MCIFQPEVSQPNRRYRTSDEAAFSWWTRSRLDFIALEFASQFYQEYRFSERLLKGRTTKDLPGCVQQWKVLLVSQNQPESFVSSNNILI